LFTADIAAARDFYVGKLGFTVAFLHGDPPFYGQMVRDGARLNLRHVDQTALAVALAGSERDALAASITVDDAQALFVEYQAAGVAFHQPLRTEPWGARNFIVADPDGNLILFAGPGA
jgi:catechol 2,3-dioxygenase-like lactoylglutathione lyase family enzyme